MLARSVIDVSGSFAQRSPMLRGGGDLALRVGRGLVPRLIVVVKVKPIFDDHPGLGIDDRGQLPKLIPPVQKPPNCGA